MTRYAVAATASVTTATNVMTAPRAAAAELQPAEINIFSGVVVSTGKLSRIRAGYFHVEDVLHSLLGLICFRLL